MMTFDQFILSPVRNAWVTAGRGMKLDLYVRKSLPFGPRSNIGVEIELANLSAEHPGHGALTAFLDRWEPHYGLLVECIVNPRLFDYLKRRGYRHFPGTRGVMLADLYKVKDTTS